MKRAVNRLSTRFAAPPCTPSEGPCTPIRRPQTPCLDLPGGKDITMEDPTKESCHLRAPSAPSETKFSGLMPGFLTEMGPLGPSVGSIERCKTVQKWMWYDPRERNPVEPRTSIKDLPPFRLSRLSPSTNRNWTLQRESPYFRAKRYKEMLISFILAFGLLC